MFASAQKGREEVDPAAACCQPTSLQTVTAVPAFPLPPLFLLPLKHHHRYRRTLSSSKLSSPSRTEVTIVRACRRPLPFIITPSHSFMNPPTPVSHLIFTLSLALSVCLSACLPACLSVCLSCGEIKCSSSLSLSLSLSLSRTCCPTGIRV